jgi:soluble lytic murein transglycosylase-like protein
MRWFVCLTLVAPAWAQDAQSIRAAMEPSLAKQRASVSRQLGMARPQAAPLRLVCNAIPAPDLNAMIKNAAETSGVSPHLIREVARQESAFRPCAVSSQGAQGLMQLMPATQATLGVGDPFDARESLSAGARLLKQLLDRYQGDLALALSAYNAGPARVDQSMAIPLIPETQNYVTRILDRLKQ